LSFLCVFSLLATAARADTLTIVTGTNSWRAIGPVGNLEATPIDTVGLEWESTNAGWSTSLTYDDSDAAGWYLPVERGTDASFTYIWGNGPLYFGDTPVYFRRVFFVNGTPTSGLLDFRADDDAQIWINGQMVVDDNNNTATTVLDSNVWQYLRPGLNLLAVKAHDSFTLAPPGFNYEYLALRLDVEFTPATLNHSPVADAGADQIVAELAPVTLHGENSFDCDSDIFSLNWVQISGPAVTLNDPNSANPTFTAPEMMAGGNTGVVTILVFQLQVSDSYAPEAACSGFTFANAVDTIEIKVTNVDNAPDADAGTDQTVNQGTGVLLHAESSSDPDGDALTFAWTQTSGPAVVLTDANTANPSFVAPAVGAGGTDLTFQVLVDDGFGGTDVDQVVIHVQNANDPPLCTLARATVAELWPPNHGLVSVGIIGISDPENDPVSISITSVTQDEPTQGIDGGDTGPDAVIQGSTVLLRAERSGSGNGRVYRINFTATDSQGGSCSGSVSVSVPHDMKQGHTSVDDGQTFNSTH